MVPKRTVVLALAGAAALLAAASPLEAEARAEAPDAEQAEQAEEGGPQAARQYHEYLKKVRLIEIRHLRSAGPAEFGEGSEKILAIRDEAAIAPLVNVLYGPNERYRTLLIDALDRFGRRGSEMAKAYLQDVAVGDGSRGHRNRAVHAIRHASGGKATDRLIAHLALGEVSALRSRAADALAELGDKRAVWMLVERLVTEEIRLAGAEVVDYNMHFDIRARVADVVAVREVTVQAAAPGAVAETTIELPEVQVIDLSTSVAMRDRQVSPEYQRVLVRHPRILAALKKLTGKDFGYDREAWQRWLQSEPEGIPEWEPIRLSSGPKDTP